MEALGTYVPTKSSTLRRRILESWWLFEGTERYTAKVLSKLELQRIDWPYRYTLDRLKHLTKLKHLALDQLQEDVDLSNLKNTSLPVTHLVRSIATL